MGLLDTIRNEIFLSRPAVAVEQILIGADRKVVATKNAVKDTAIKVVDNATSGLKWGLIVAFALLALFLIAQAKTLTAAFKE